MASPRPLVLVALAAVLAPACGHKGPPIAPRRNTPPSLTDFRLAQRGDALEVSCTAPASSVDGVTFRRVDVEILWGEGQVDLEKAGQRRTVEAMPGQRVVERLPLPAPGTLVRAAGRAVVGRNRGQRSLIAALEAQSPLVPPRDLGVGLREKGVTLSWKGAMPERVEPLNLAPPGFSSGDPFSRERPAESSGPAEESNDAREGEGGEAERDSALEEGGGGVEAPESAGEAPGDQTAAAGEPAEGAATIPETAVTEEPPEDARTPPRIHGFRVYRRVDPGSYRIPLNRQPQARRVFTDTAAPMGQTVCYVVRAAGSIDPLIESAPSNEACVTVRDIVPPAPPTGLAVVPRGAALEVLWSPASDPGLAGYRVYRSRQGREARRIAEVPVGTTTWLDTTGEAGILYRYTVTAVDDAGNEGPASGSAEGIR